MGPSNSGVSGIESADKVASAGGHLCGPKPVAGVSQIPGQALAKRLGIYTHIHSDRSPVRVAMPQNIS